MNIRYPIYEGVYRILTLIVNNLRCRQKSTEKKMEAAQKGCAGPPLHLRKDSRLCKQKLQKPFVYP